MLDLFFHLLYILITVVSFKVRSLCKTTIKLLNVLEVQIRLGLVVDAQFAIAIAFDQPWLEVVCDVARKVLWRALTELLQLSLSVLLLEHSNIDSGQIVPQVLFFCCTITQQS